MLRVRDARITATSVAALREQLDPTQSIPLVNSGSTISGALSWRRVASLLETSLDEVRMWLARRQLRVVDTFITEKALEEFCRRCNRNGGPKLSYRLVDPKVLQWLKDYGITVPTPEIKSSVSGFEKHAFLTRVCSECGRSIRGNAYFIHIRACKGAGVGDQKVLGPTEGMPRTVPRSVYQPRL
jgi:hypothetical protein